jgi:hypothetical protein
MQRRRYYLQGKENVMPKKKYTSVSEMVSELLRRVFADDFEEHLAEREEVKRIEIASLLQKQKDEALLGPDLGGEG